MLVNMKGTSTKGVSGKGVVESCSRTAACYTGKFKNGMRQGFGTYVYHINKMKGETKPRRYEGQWQQSEKKGSGRNVARWVVLPW